MSDKIKLMFALWGLYLIEIAHKLCLLFMSFMVLPIGLIVWDSEDFMGVVRHMKDSADLTKEPESK